MRSLCVRGFQKQNFRIDADLGEITAMLDWILLVGAAFAGDRLIMGTDAMGFPTIVPGESAFFELSLLTKAGLSPFAALKTATVNPAKFLGKTGEFGIIAPNARADAVLLDRNPLEDLGALREPRAVLVRGKWLPREDLDRMLQALTAHGARGSSLATTRISDRVRTPNLRTIATA